MKTFKEFQGNPPTQKIEEQVYFKIRIPDMSTMFMKATSESAVKLDMRKKLKPDVVKEVTIERVTKAEMRKIYRAMGQGKEDEPEPTEEGILDLLTKKGRDKQAKVKKRLAGVRKTRDQDEKDWEAWRRASSKASGRSGTQADVDRQKELEKKPYVRDRLKKYREKERERTKSR